MTRFFSIPIFLLLIWLSPSLRVYSAERPNFILIMADDLGYGDLSCYGNTEYKTPHLDRMAGEGMRFTDFHSSGPVCSPTRAGLLTGRYQQRAGIGGVVYADPKQNRHHGLQPQEITFAERLREAGYRTALFGKWHLGYEPRYNPVHQGFDTFRGYVSGNIDYHSHFDRMGIADWWQDDSLKDEKGYTTHLITRHALRFIETNRDRPFCLYVAHEAPHDPYQGPDDPAIRVEGKGVPNRYADGQVARAYRELVQEMDEGIGQIIEALDASGLSRNTLIFFLSDNGANRNGSNGSLRGFKGSLWEGGHRVPAIARWPGIIPAGTTNEVLSMSIDLMPTLMDFAGLEVDSRNPLDGVSLRPELTGSGSLEPRKLFWEYRGAMAVCDGDWKLLIPATGDSDPMLFNLAADRSEQNDRSNAHPERVAELSKELRGWLAEVKQGATPQPD